ncbi:hypothetical protein ACLUTX_12730 [Enterobacterales bacterium AE_CKDN230030158-1A_HGKHYDSX7]
MNTDVRIKKLSEENQSKAADIQALNVIINGLLQQIRESQGALNLDAAELRALTLMREADDTSDATPNPVLVAQFFTNARRSN